MASPFAGVRLPVAVAAAYGAAALVWVAAGDGLPGGRWLAVHLFTLGVLSNLVIALSGHFAQTLLHTPDRSGVRWRLPVWNAGALLLLAGLPAGALPVFAAGALVALATVVWLYLGLRRMRRQSLGGRFAFVVRGYERSCGAFVHGGLLGLLIGTGVLGGAWYSGARLAHLHVNVLGWGGLTLLATAVFFGPTVMRARIEEGAETGAATALRTASTALAAATLLLLPTGFPGAVGTAARLAAAAGLAVYAGAVTVVCLPVLRTLRRARLSAPALQLGAACAWLVAAAWADAAVIAAGHLRLLEALGVIVLLGVLAQAMVATVGYLAPMLAGRRPGRPRVSAPGLAGTVALNLAVVVTAARTTGVL